MQNVLTKLNTCILRVLENNNKIWKKSMQVFMMMEYQEKILIAFVYQYYWLILFLR